MYSSVKSSVKFKNNVSQSFDSNIGVKQGDPSSTLLFLYFVNDMINNFNNDIEGLFTHNDIKLFMLLFADDTVLFAHTPEALQSLLNDLNIYCNTWGLKVSSHKTKIMIFEKGRSTSHAFIYDNNQLEIVKTFIYVG